MPGSASLRVSVVGRNISSAIWLRTLCESGLSLELSWHHTEQDRHLIDSPMWVLMPALLRGEWGDALPAWSTQEPFVFLQGARRMRLRDFVEEGDSRHPVPLAVRRKLAALALWNDMTPSLWKEDRVGRREPDPTWVRRAPESMGPQWGAPFYLVPRATVLKNLEVQLAQRSVMIPQGDSVVLGIEAGSRTEGHRLVHNAPFGFSISDRVLWMSVTRKIKDEGVRHWRRLTSVSPEIAGRWVSFGAWVDAALVAALPRLSIWYEARQATAFFKTGLQDSRALRRVFCIDAAAMGGPQGRCWLQIEEMELEGPLDEPRSAAPDAFLWGLCPGLASVKTAFLESRLEENHFLANPSPRSWEFGPRIEGWFAGSLGLPSVAARQWLGRSFPAREKPLAGL